MAERVQKLLARCGMGSRRQIEAWISQGRVAVNGRVVSLGDQAEPADRITVDGRPVPRRGEHPRRRVLLYHKPVGEVTTRRDPEGRPTVFDRLKPPGVGRWLAVGRLDLNTSGLLLLTTDGELANRLTHPRYQVQRTYAVRVHGEVAADALQRLQAGIELDDGMARFESITDAGGTGTNHWYHVTLREGRHREVRRLWDAVGVTVSRLIRIGYEQFNLPRDLRPGRSRELTPVEVDALAARSGLAALSQSRRAVPRKAGRKRGRR